MRRNFLCKKPGVKSNRNGHSLKIVAHIRIENWFVFKTGDFFHFRKVLVGLRKCIKARRIKFGISSVCFVLCNCFFSCPGIAGNCVNDNRIVRRHNAGFYKRISQRNKTACITAWNGYAV